MEFYEVKQMSLLLTANKDTGDTSVIDVKFTPPVDLGDVEKMTEKDGKTWMVALSSLNMWNSYYNISDALFDNATITYKSAVPTTYSFTMPAGSYSIEEINALLLLDLEANTLYDPLVDTFSPIEIYPNYNTGKVELKINTAGWAFDLSTSLLYLIFGFSAAQATGGDITVDTTADNIANIQNGVNQLEVRTSLLSAGQGSFTNGGEGNTLFAFVPRSPSGSSLEVAPNQRVYIPISPHLRQLSNMRVEITDQNGNHIELNGDSVSVILHLQRR